MRVEFKRGRERDLPKEGNLGTLFFTWDTGKIFEGNGKGKKLSLYSSVINGYLNKEDLILKNPAIEGKIYITDNDGAYFFNGSEYIELGGKLSLPYEYYEKIIENSDTNGESLKIIDFKDFIIENNVRSIVSSELIIRNISNNHKLELIILDRNIQLININLNPNETQKYLLGISTNIKVFVKGIFDCNFYINYYSNEKKGEI